MDEALERLLDQSWDMFIKAPENTRFLIAIGGIPGSGKTTLSKRLTAALNARHAAQFPNRPPVVAAFVPMDGYHYTRARLDAMPDPATAHARRGAEFTFDGDAFVALVRRLKEEPLNDATPTVYAPSFDHAIKDPKEDDIAVERTHRIVVLEGNYTLLNKHPWSAAAALYSLTVFVTVPRAVARARLAARHLAAGLAADPEAADRRAIENDLPNGDEIIRLRIPHVDVVIESLEDGGWAAG
ncbi:P-loop containing nucleoside triphosphate hydrolase protein [Corynascus novoguineensis]|uniref:P-loop containing nucleoside triphosphate hydrolase protein n=1 Tax=Corynascus novoguineensis TaxID=1126955 RepID=A0AAN7HUG8_9PEZI|nr:P-loop containing nucleoside triphosphate hydrolase protein [Corynascus novoguineensis]